MDLTLTNKMMKQAGEETMKTLLEELGHDKEFVLTVRLDKGLGRALEEQAKVWGMKNTSTAVRTVLSFYFLPAVYQLEWKDKDFFKVVNSKELSSEKMRANYFLKALLEYMAFLEQAGQASRQTLDIVSETQNKLDAIIGEMTDKMKKSITEMESKQDA